MAKRETHPVEPHVCTLSSPEDAGDAIDVAHIKTASEPIAAAPTAAPANTVLCVGGKAYEVQGGVVVGQAQAPSSGKSR